MATDAASQAEVCDPLRKKALRRRLEKCGSAHKWLTNSSCDGFIHQSQTRWRVECLVTGEEDVIVCGRSDVSAHDLPDESHAVFVLSFVSETSPPAANTGRCVLTRGRIV